MNFFKKLFRKKGVVQEQVLKCNVANRRLVNILLYNLIIRYTGINYGFNPAQAAAAIDVTNSKIRYLMKVQNADGTYTYEFNYTTLSKETYTMSEWLEVAEDIFDEMRYSEDDPELIAKSGVLHLINIENLCRNIYRFVHKYELVDLVDEVFTNNIMMQTVQRQTFKGNDLPDNVIFHTYDGFRNERTYNVVDRALNDSYILADIDYLTLVYTGNNFDPACMSSPLVPTLDYVIVRSYYARHKIGQEVGMTDLDPEMVTMLRTARMLHIKKAHEYCISYINEYMASRGIDLNDVRNIYGK